MNAEFDTYHRTSIFADDALKTVESAFKIPMEKGEKIVAHCSAGIGRGSLGLACWLVKRHSLSAEDASERVARAGDAAGVVRKPNAKKLGKLLADGKLTPKKK